MARKPPEQARLPLIDRMLLGIAPGFVARRCRSRFAVDRMRRIQAAYYDGAANTRQTVDWDATTGSANDTLGADAETLIGRARNLVRNNGWARSAKLAYERNVIGSAGIQVFPETENERFNERAEDLWRDWSEHSSFCDVERTLTFPEIQRQIVGQVWEAGEMFVRLVTEGDREHPIRLQRLEVESLNTGMFAAPVTNNEVVRGIEMDSYHAPLAYHFLGKNSTTVGGMFSAMDVAIPAEQIRHVFLQDRPGQTHGVPYLHAVMTTLRALADFDLWTLEAAKIQACLGLIVKQEQPETGFGGVPRTDETDVCVDENSILEPSLVYTCRPGESAETMKINQPGENYGPYVDAQMQSISAGTDLSPSVVQRDFSKGSYASLRQALLEDQRAFRWWQQVVISRLVRPVYERFVTLHVLSGKLKARNFWSNPAAYLKADYLPPGFLWIDPLKEAQAMIILWRHGLMTAKEIAAHKGQHWKRILRQWAKERKFTMDEVGYDPLAEGQANAPVESVEPVESAESAEARIAPGRINGRGLTPGGVSVV